MPTPTVINKFRYSDVINRRYWDNKYFFEPMSVNPAVSKVGGGAAAGAGAEVDVMITPRNAFEYFNIVGNTNIGPKLDGSFGLNLAADATNTHGVEYDTGITTQNNFTFKIDQTGATTPAFFLKGVFKVATINGAELILGFRQLAARNAAYTTYANYAVIGQIGGAGKFQMATNLASAGQVLTDSTQTGTNAVVFEIKVLVDAFGNVTYELNGKAPTVIPTIPYQFPNGITVMPFLRVTQTATTTATASCNYFECGFQS